MNGKFFLASIVGGLALVGTDHWFLRLVILAIALVIAGEAGPAGRS